MRILLGVAGVLVLSACASGGALPASSPTTKPRTITTVRGRVVGSLSSTVAGRVQIEGCAEGGLHVSINPLPEGVTTGTAVSGSCSSGRPATMPPVPAAHSTRFVGTYEVELTTHGLPSYFDGGKLVLHPDGTATGAGTAARWGNRGENVVIVARPGPGLAGGGGGALSGGKTSTGIASKQEPGEWILAGTDVGFWYGVKVTS